MSNFVPPLENLTTHTAIMEIERVDNTKKAGIFGVQRRRNVCEIYVVGMICPPSFR
jgi:hypothetical protein